MGTDLDTDSANCKLCNPGEVLFENALAYAHDDSNSPSRGHILSIPKRHDEVQP
jgi:diadenosine tetraphosphate (Ap4A) HIT family hydrolase